MDKIELLKNVANELEQKFYFKSKPLKHVFLEEDYQYLDSRSDVEHVVITEDGIKTISYCSDPREYGCVETVYNCVDDFFINRYSMNISLHADLFAKKKITGDTDDIDPIKLMISNQYITNPKFWDYRKKAERNFRNAICVFVKKSNINKQLGYKSPKLEKQGAKWQNYCTLVLIILMVVFFIVEYFIDSSIFGFTYPLLCSYGFLFTSLIEVGTIYDNYQITKRNIGFDKVDKLMTLGQKFSFITLICLIFYTIMLFVDKTSTLYKIAWYSVLVAGAINIYLFYAKEEK